MPILSFENSRSVLVGDSIQDLGGKMSATKVGQAQKWVQQFSEREYLCFEGACVGAIAIIIRLWDLHKIDWVTGTLGVIGGFLLAGVTNWLRFPRPPIRGCIFAALQGVALALATGAAVHSMDPLHHSIAQLYSLSTLGVAGYLLPGIFLSQHDIIVRRPAPFFRLLTWLRNRSHEQVAALSSANELGSAS